MKKLIFFLPIILIVMGIVLYPNQLDQFLHRLLHGSEIIPSTETECLQVNGQWEPGPPPLSSSYRCNLVFPDGNKPCWSGFQCLSGLCQVNRQGASEVPPARFGPGTCSSQTSSTASYYPVLFGIRHPGITILD